MKMSRVVLARINLHLSQFRKLLHRWRRFFSHISDVRTVSRAENRRSIAVWSDTVKGGYRLVYRLALARLMPCQDHSRSRRLTIATLSPQNSRHFYSAGVVENVGKLLRCERINIEPTSWDSTIFVSGFLYSGSSAAADFLNDFQGVVPAPPEPPAFREGGIPSVHSGSISPYRFWLEHILGHSRNPWLQSGSWLEHAKNAGYVTQVLTQLEETQRSGTLDLALLAQASLTRQSSHLVLDNTLHRADLRLHTHYSGAQWVFVVRDFCDQYVDINNQSNVKWSSRQFASFINKEFQRAADHAARFSQSAIWVRFEDLIRNSATRDDFASRLGVHPRQSVATRFIPSASLKNIGIGVGLPREDVKVLKHVQSEVFSQILDHACGSWI